MPTKEEITIQDDDEIDLNSDSDNESDNDNDKDNNNKEDSENKSNGNGNGSKAMGKEERQQTQIEIEHKEAKPTLKATTEALEATKTTKTTSKKSKLQDRLRKLQLKINQSKKLNHQQVLNEGERLSSKEAFQKHKKQTIKNDKKQKEQEEWDGIHQKNVSTLLGTGTGAETGPGVAGGSSKKELKALMQSGSESLRQSYKKMEKREKGKYSTNDYYNSEGQFKNYERSLKSISNGFRHSNNTNTMGAEISSSSYNTQSIERKEFNRERNGAKRLADEFKRRSAKADKRKQKEMDFEATDISSINKRNKHFNEKISRNYDKHTAEIRQNLERGTAL